MGAAAWLQSIAGFGPRVHSFGFCSFASVHGMWFVGAFGRWVGPLPSPAAVMALWRLNLGSNPFGLSWHAASRVRDAPAL